MSNKANTHYSTDRKQRAETQARSVFASHDKKTSRLLPILKLMC
jgi:hypothetical protein